MVAAATKGVSSKPKTKNAQTIANYFPGRITILPKFDVINLKKLQKNSLRFRAWAPSRA